MTVEYADRDNGRGGTMLAEYMISKCKQERIRALTAETRLDTLDHETKGLLALIRAKRVIRLLKTRTPRGWTAEALRQLARENPERREAYLRLAKEAERA